TFAAGASLVLPSAATGSAIAAAMERTQPTVLIGVPRLYSALLAGVEARARAAGGLARRAFGAFARLSRSLRGLGINVGPLLFRPVHARMGGRLRILVSGGAKLEASVQRG